MTARRQMFEREVAHEYPPGLRAAYEAAIRRAENGEIISGQEWVALMQEWAAQRQEFIDGISQ